MLRHPPDVWMCTMFGHPHMFGLYPYVWMPPLCLDVPYIWTPSYAWMPSICLAAPCMFGCPPNVWGIQKYQGHPNIWVVSEYMGVSKHTGASKHMGASKYMGDIYDGTCLLVLKGVVVVHRGSLLNIHFFIHLLWNCIHKYTDIYDDIDSLAIKGIVVFEWGIYSISISTSNSF